MDCVLSSHQLKSIDRFLENYYPSFLSSLMETAGLSIAKILADTYDQFQPVCVVSGHGHNGGDGFVVARHLFNWGYNVSVVLIDSHRTLKSLTKEQHRLLSDFTSISIEPTLPILSSEIILIDALFGIGLSRPLSDNYRFIIDQMNSSESPIISIDIPSGLSADSYSEWPAIIASQTLSFTCLKPIFLEEKAQSHIGKLSILDIGIPPSLIMNPPLYV